MTDRLEGTLAATALAAAAGARVFRAHEVAATRRTVDMVAAITGYPTAGADGARAGLSVPAASATAPDRRARSGHGLVIERLVRPPHLAGAAVDASTSWSRPRPAGGSSVVLPALDEEATVGAIVAAIVPLTRGPAPLVDELVVIDSGSTDRTVEVAAAAGARVVLRTDVLPELRAGARQGRGAVALAGRHHRRRSSATSTPTWSTSTRRSCPALLGPLLTEPGVQLVKGFYRRPLRLETTEADTGGGRVTELLVRPLLAALRPELAGIVQPLGGEYAGTRELLESVPFAAGYGVEIGLLLDTHAAPAGWTRWPRSTWGCASTATGRCCSWG